MATLNLKSIPRLVSDQAAAMQAASSTLLDFSKGAVLLAFVEATAAVAAWLQSLILMVLAVTRLTTSTGVDVDTFIADFNLSRLQSSGSAGSVTFSRYSPQNSAIIPVGATVQVPGGTVAFSVIADPTNATYIGAPTNGYLIAAGVTSITVAVASTSTGQQTNVQAGTVTQMTTSISGVDTVTNNAAMTGGIAAETDAAVKVRFIKYILGLSKGDAYGLASAIANLNLGVTYTLTDQYTYDGSFKPGYYYVVVDDGTGYPSQTFLNSVAVAVNSVKPLGCWFGIFPPQIAQTDVSAIVATAPGYDRNTVIGQVSTLIASNITALGLGSGLQWTQIAAWVWSVPGVSGLTALYLNGVSDDSSDIPANNQVRLLPRNITVG